MGEIRKGTFPILGMSCASCAARVDKALNGQPGVQEASVNYASATAQVTYDADVCSPLALKAAVQQAGYDLLAASKVEETHTLGNRFGRTYYGAKHGLYASHMGELCGVALGDSRCFRVGKGILHQCMEATETWRLQYGYARGTQHRHCLFV